jgi:serine/threonine-protein kinase
MQARRFLDGALIAGHRLEERLGGGGRGEVHRARHERTGRVVAVKVLREPAALGPLRCAMEVRHPNLVRLREAGVDGAGAYVVMEYLEGATLRDVLAVKGRLEVEAAIAVLLPVLGALHAAHALGVLHGDLKPENVFLQRPGPDGVTVKLLDLGGMAAAPGGEAEGAPGGGPDGEVVFGSAAYLSPERAAGEAVDARSDVFGAAVLLFELVTGRPPFAATGPVATAYRIVHQPAPPIGDTRLQPVLDVALAKAPAHRFATAALFAEALAARVPGAGREALDALDSGGPGRGR